MKTTAENTYVFQEASEEAALECVEKTLEEVAALKFECERENFFNNTFKIVSRADRLDVFDMRWRSRDGVGNRAIKSQASGDAKVPEISGEFFKELWQFLRRKVDEQGVLAYTDFKEEIKNIFPEFADFVYPCFAIFPYFSEEGRPIGELICFFRTKRSFGPRYVEMLRLLAQNLSVSRTRLVLYDQLTKQLALAEEAQREKNLFFASVTHDIRTPLNSIIGFSDLLRVNNLDDSTRRQYVDAIATSGQQLLQLVNDVLDLAKIDTGKMEIVPEFCDFSRLLAALKKAMLPVAKGKQLRLKTEMGENFPIVKIDAQRTRQVLFQLVGNALKFTDSGWVKISAEFERSQDVPGTGILKFAVADSGPGIPEVVQANVRRDIVRPHRADRRNGTGLGLSVSRKLIDLMGGAMSIEVKKGIGSIVSVLLPSVAFSGDALAVKPAAAEEPPAPEKELTLSTLRVLLVDDMNVNLQVLKTMMQRLGVKEITLAHSAGEAIEILEQGEKIIDFVFTDMWMPEMGGSELVKHLRKNPRFKALSVYAVTADVEVVKDYKKLGFTGVVLKPITLNALGEHLKNFLKKE